MHNSFFYPETFIEKSELSPDEIAFFKSNGWLGKFSLLTQKGVDEATAIHHRTLNDFTWK